MFYFFKTKIKHMSRFPSDDIIIRAGDDESMRRYKIVLQKHQTLRTFGIIASIASLIAFGFAIFVFVRELNQEKIEKKRVDAYLNASDRFANVLSTKELALEQAQARVEKQTKDIDAIRNETEQMHKDVLAIQSQLQQLQKT